MKITLTKIAKFTTKKDGSPLIGSNGRPYTSVRIQCNEHGAKWISGFEGAETKTWKEGDTVEVDIKENGEYLNFTTPKKVQSGMDEAQAYQIKQASESAYAANIGIQQLTKALRDAGVIKDPNKFVNNTDVPYPDSEGDMPF